MHNVLLSVLIGVLIWGAAKVGDSLSPKPVPVPIPVPTPGPAPEPRPQPQPEPRRKIRPWREDAQLALGAEPAPDGTEPQIDFPDEQWMKNIGSRLDGAGMCVFTSFEHACRWAGLEEFRGFRDWCAQNYPGGGYPEKLDKLIDAFCKAKGVTRPLVIQYEGSSPEIIEAALQQGLLPCVTLYRSPRYGRGTIYHMVNSAHLDSKLGATLDNNFKPLEWAPREETIARYKMRGTLWCVAVVAPGPPPMPRN